MSLRHPVWMIHVRIYRVHTLLPISICIHAHTFVYEYIHLLKWASGNPEDSHEPLWSLQKRDENISKKRLFARLFAQEILDSLQKRYGNVVCFGRALPQGTLWTSNKNAWIPQWAMGCRNRWIPEYHRILPESRSIEIQHWYQIICFEDIKRFGYKPVQKTKDFCQHRFVSK